MSEWMVLLLVALGYLWGVFTGWVLWWRQIYGATAPSDDGAPLQ